MPAPRRALPTSVRAQKCGMVMPVTTQIIFPYMSDARTPAMDVQMTTQDVCMTRSFHVFLSAMLIEENGYQPRTRRESNAGASPARGPIGSSLTAAGRRWGPGAETRLGLAWDRTWAARRWSPRVSRWQRGRTSTERSQWRIADSCRCTAARRGAAPSSSTTVSRRAKQHSRFRPLPLTPL